MQQRKALIVTGAAGPQDIANGVLQRFGFAPAVSALNLSEGVAQMRGEHFDLLIVPLQGTAAAELASLDRLMRRTHVEGKGGITIAVYSAKGGVGTTSVAVNLAFALARTHPNGRVALADLVASGGDIRVMLDLKPTYDMGDLIRKVDRIDAELLHSVLTPCAGGVWVLPSAEDPEVAEAFDAAAATTLIEQLRAHFAFTVIDCEHHMSERTLAALDTADRVVLVTQLNVPALRSAQRTIALCQRLGYSGDKL